MRFLLGALGWGIIIYALMYLLWSGLVIYGLAIGLTSLAVRIVALAGITIFAARSLHMTNWRDLVPYTLTWAVCAVVLDAIFLVPFSGFALYTSWSVWVGYALVAILPLIASLRRPRPAAIG